MKARLVRSSTSLLLAAGLGCGSAGATNEHAAGESGEAGETGEHDCSPCDAWRSCLRDNCGEIVDACLGPDYFEGVNGGACEQTSTCTDACACEDDACEQSCQATAEPACLSCTTMLRQCELEFCDADALCA